MKKLFLALSIFTMLGGAGLSAVAQVANADAEIATSNAGKTEKEVSRETYDHNFINGNDYHIKKYYADYPLNYYCYKTVPTKLAHHWNYDEMQKKFLYRKS